MVKKIMFVHEEKFLVVTAPQPKIYFLGLVEKLPTWHLFPISSDVCLCTMLVSQYVYHWWSNHCFKSSHLNPPMQHSQSENYTNDSTQWTQLTILAYYSSLIYIYIYKCICNQHYNHISHCFETKEHGFYCDLWLFTGLTMPCRFHFLLVDACV